MTKESYQLTKYPLGSIREMVTVAWPLMLSLLSGSFMFFFDRFFLGIYSLDAMNAAASSGMGAWAILVLPIAVASISEVFVGQFHGKSEFEYMGKAAWQLIWFSILIWPLFFLLANVFSKYMFVESPIKSMQITYFSCVMNFGSFFCLSIALTGFFAGQGKVKLIAMSAILGNLVNILLDYLLIFGIGIFPSLGVLGAAIGTVVAQIFQIGFFLIFFLNKKNKKEAKTLNWKLDKELFKDSLKVGFPAGVSHFSEFMAHFVFFNLMIMAGREYITIVVLVQSLYLMIVFILEGQSKAVIAISSNFIGAKKYDYVDRNVKSAFKMQFLFFLLIFLMFLIFSPDIFKIFVSRDNMQIFQNADFLSRLYKTSIFVGIFFLTDGLVWILIGMLIAAGDTKFIMKVGILAPWILYITPIYIGIKNFDIRVNQSWAIISLYSMILFGIYFLRYKSKKWKKIKIY